jgi:hypothetical protein
MGTLAVIRQLKLLQFVRDLMSDGQDYFLATLWSLGQEAIQFLDDSARFGLLLGIFAPASGVAYLVLPSALLPINGSSGKQHG